MMSVRSPYIGYASGLTYTQSHKIAVAQHYHYSLARTHYTSKTADTMTTKKEDHKLDLTLKQFYLFRD